jgi:hypothetical protein
MFDDFIPQLDLSDDKAPDLQNVDEGNDGQEKDNLIENPDKPITDDFVIDASSLTDNDDEDDSSDPLVEEKQVLAAYNTFVSKGILAESEEPPKSWDDLDKQIEQLPNIVAQSLVAQAPELGQKLLSFIFSSGDQLTVDKLKDFYAEYLDLTTTVMSTEIKTEEDAEAYLTNVYRSKNLPEAAIRAALVTLKDEEQLLDVAKEELDKEKAAKEAKIDDKITKEADATKDRQQKAQNFWNGISESLNTTSWSTQKKQEVLGFMKQDLKDRVQKIYTDPAALIHFADFVSKYDPDKKEFDLTSFKNQVVSKDLNKTKDNILKDAFSSISSTTKGKDGNPNKVFKIENLEPII